MGLGAAGPGGGDSGAVGTVEEGGTRSRRGRGRPEACPSPPHLRARCPEQAGGPPLGPGHSGNFPPPPPGAGPPDPSSDALSTLGETLAPLHGRHLAKMSYFLLGAELCPPTHGLASQSPTPQNGAVFGGEEPVTKVC